MSTSESTCWTMVEAAAGGDGLARGRFAEIYLSVVRAYLGARWRSHSVISDLDDAVQEVFLECYRPGGALSRLDRDGPGAFRTFLYSVATNVARRHEERSRTKAVASADSEVVGRIPDDSPTHSIAFDRAWAQAMLARARERQRAAAGDDPERLRRVELLDLRFRDGMPVRDIAVRWAMTPERVHALYRKAREEFKGALIEEVAFHGHKGAEAAERECRRLLEIVSAER